MDFKKYNSIENSYRIKFLDKIKEEGHGALEYTVTEKIHGANYSIWATKDEVKAAKRSGFIGKDEKFYNHEAIFEKYKDKVKSMLTFGDIQEIVVFGELYGGSYPHPEVPRENVSAVQKGVFYRPDQDFIAFDVMVNGQYLHTESAITFLRIAEIPYAKVLFQGSLEECLAYSNEFPTTIPKELGLPEIEGNTCEGVVIKPLIPTFLWSKERLILKNKNEKFKEETGSSDKKPPREEKPLPEHVQNSLSNVSGYITKNRLQNVISKVGTISKDDFSKLMKLFTADIMEDFMKDHQESFNALEKEERKLVSQKVGQGAALMLRNDFLNIVDGNY